MISGKDVLLDRTPTGWVARLGLGTVGWSPFPWTAVGLPAMLTEAQARRRGLALLGKQERRHLAKQRGAGNGREE